AVVEEGPHPEVRIDAVDAGRIDGAVRHRPDDAELDALGEEPLGGRLARRRGARDRRGADRAQVRGHLVGEHLLETEAEEMRRVAAIGAGDDVATEAGGAARTAMAAGAGIGEPRTERAVFFDV